MRRSRRRWPRSRRAGFRVAARSRWWRTPAWPPGAGPEFVNGAALLDGPDDPAAALAALHAVEAELGRRRSGRWEPRVCDLDLIASGARVLPDAATVRGWIAREGDDRLAAPPGLLLPHPRMQERGFVLRPLAEIAPGLAAPAARGDGRRDAGGAACRGAHGDRAALTAGA